MPSGKSSSLQSPGLDRPSVLLRPGPRPGTSSAGGSLGAVDALLCLGVREASDVQGDENGLWASRGLIAHKIKPSNTKMLF